MDCGRVGLDQEAGVLGMQLHLLDVLAGHSSYGIYGVPEAQECDLDTVPIRPSKKVGGQIPGCLLELPHGRSHQVGGIGIAGLLRIEYPTMWASIDRRAADLQDLFFNEPWFLLEGLGFGAIGWIALGPGSRRRWWVGSAIAATSVLTVIGMLSATGVIGKVIIG